MGSSRPEDNRTYLSLILRPVVRFCVRNGIAIQDFYETAKQLFVDAASESLAEHNNPVNTSRLSVATGLRRREVDRIVKMDSPGETKTSVLTRVIGRWLSMNHLLTESGEPRPLSCNGEQSEFYELVREVSKDVSPGTVLSELERISAVKKDNDAVLLLVDAYQPVGDPEEGFRMLGEDVDDLLIAVEENISGKEEVPNHHATTEFFNIAATQLGEFRTWILKEGAAFHRKIRSYLAASDKDVNPELTGKGNYRIAVGSFSRIEDRNTNDTSE